MRIRNIMAITGLLVGVGLTNAVAQEPTIERWLEWPYEARVDYLRAVLGATKAYGMTCPASVNAVGAERLMTLSSAAMPPADAKRLTIREATMIIPLFTGICSGTRIHAARRTARRSAVAFWTLRSRYSWSR